MIIDIIALILIGLCIFVGVKKGFVKTFFTTASFVFALFLTIMMINPFCQYIKETELGQKVYESVEVNIVEEYNKNQGVVSDIPALEEFLEKAGDFEESVSASLGDLVLKAICSLLLFIALTIILKLLTKLLDAVFKLPGLKFINKVGGFLAGVVNAYIFMMLLTCVIMLLMPTSFGETLAKELYNSKITIWFYENNLFF